jgi:hypothetical protein
MFVAVGALAIVAFARPAFSDTLTGNRGTWLTGANARADETGGSVVDIDDFNVTGNQVTFGDVTATASRLLQETAIGTGWRTWNDGYTGHVLSTTAKSLTLTFNSADLVNAFGFYLEPNPYRTFKFSVQVTSYNGTTHKYATTKLSQSVFGDGGAKFWGWLASSGSYLTKIAISSKVGFALGEVSMIGTSRTGPPISTPGPVAGAGLPMLIAGVMWLRRRGPARDGSRKD